MFIKQISKDEALQLASKGQDILIMVPGEGDGSWNHMVPDTLHNLLAGLMFFRKEPALENQILEEDNTPPRCKSNRDVKKPSGSTPKPATNSEASGAEGSGAEKKKRVAVDTGKMLALRNAGWTMKKIAEELGISECTVFNYLKKMEMEDKR